MGLVARLSALKIDLTILQNERAKLESPVLGVPYEILSYIFELAHQEELASLYPACAPTFPITISHVSRHFRIVAIQTLTLWTVIRVRDFEDPRLDYLETCLQRSGTLPLSLLLNCTTPGSPPRSATMQVTILIRSNLSRVERFAANFESSKAICRIVRKLDKPAPQLTSLKLSYWGDDDNNGPTQTFSRKHAYNFPSLLPGNKLTELKLRGVPIPWWRCDFKNLTELVLEDYFAGLSLGHQEFWTIIENSASSLRRLRLGCFRLRPTSPTNLNIQKPYVLKSLDRLELLTISLNDSLTILSYLHIPDLELIDIADMTIEEDYTDLLNRIAGPPALFPKLTTLCLGCVRLSRADGIGALERAYPELTPEACLVAGDSVSLFATRKASKEHDIDSEEHEFRNLFFPGFAYSLIHFYLDGYNGNGVCTRTSGSALFLVLPHDDVQSGFMRTGF